ncbi:MAG: VapB-type antitoxin [Thermoprotei archaeon]|nr:MAG: VapB-type antitoxin [Thermoprotei archaeon]
MSTVVSVRIRREVKEVLERAGIDIAAEVRRFLEELAWRVMIREHVKKWDRILERVKPSPKGFAERSVREDREAR